MLSDTTSSDIDKLLDKLKIYGVTGVGQSNPTLTRTDDAVGLTYTVNMY